MINNTDLFSELGIDKNPNSKEHHGVSLVSTKTPLAAEKGVAKSYLRQHRV